VVAMMMMMMMMMMTYQMETEGFELVDGDQILAWMSLLVATNTHCYAVELWCGVVSRVLEMMKGIRVNVTHVKRESFNTLCESFNHQNKRWQNNSTLV
jgi:hypothetical protein